MTEHPLKSVADLSDVEIRACTSSLRSLAVALVRDDSAADDLVQEALGVAIQRPRPVQHLLAYMKGMVRRLALRRHDVERRRELREREHARPEAVPSDDELAERVELLQSVLLALESLPAAQRRAVSLRYIDGMKAVDIARREGKSPETVRSLTSRGLAKMRSELDRGQDRDSWSALLATPTLVSEAAGPRGLGEPLTTLGGGSVRTVAGFLGWFSMSTSAKLTLALVPLVALGSWLTFKLAQGRTVSTQETLESQADKPEEQLGQVSVDDEEPSAARRDAVEGAPAASGAAKTSSVPEGVVVDAHTGDRLPYLSIRLASLAGDAVPVELKTNLDGEFRGAESFDHGEINFTRIGPEVAPGLPRMPEVTQQLSFPLEGPIEVQVGPTFFFTPRPPDELPPEGFTATLTAPATHPRFQVAAPLRDEALTWTRFEFHHLLPLLEAPLHLSITDDAGYWVAESSAPRALGVESTPIALNFTQTGVVLFRLDAPLRNEMLLQSVEVWPEDGGDRRRIWLRDANGDMPTGTGTARHLPAGDYAWSTHGLTEEPITGTVAVVAGQTTEVSIAVPSDIPTFDAVILVVDPSGERDLSGWPVQIRDIEGSLHGLQGRIEPAPSRTPGEWRIVLKDLPSRVWSVIPSSPKPTAIIEPALLKIRPDESPGEFRIVEVGPFETVEIEVVSAVTGEDLASARVALFTRPSTGEEVHRSPLGAFRPVQMPRDGDSMVYATAPGHRMAVASHRPGRDGGRVTLRLEPGGSTYVDVWNFTRSERLRGVQIFVNGEPAGRTDENGRLWLEYDSPPESLSIDPGELELAVDPMDEDLEEALSSPFGLVFGLREK